MTSHASNGGTGVGPQLFPQVLSRPGRPGAGVRLGRIGAALALALLISAPARVGAEPAAVPEIPGLYAEIETPRGTLVARLFFEQVPMTVGNFVGLAEGTLGPRPGVPYYDGLTFHRVVPGFVVQGGDPTGTGEGGPGYLLPDEFVPGMTHGITGVLSMANNGPDTNGSQFFFTLAPAARLDYLHTVFGQVVRGLDVLPRIRQGDRMQVRIHRVGTPARRFQADRAAVEARAARLPRAKNLPNQPVHFEDTDGVLPSDLPRARHLDAKLANLERAAGVRLFMRLKRSAPAGVRPSDLAAAEAAKLGLADDAQLVVYVSDREAWGGWAGTGRQRRHPRWSESMLDAWTHEGAPTARAPSAAGGEEAGAERVRRACDAVLQRLIPLLVNPAED